jgi:hypothetical protein
MMKRAKRHNAGAILLELTASIFVATIALLGALEAYHFGLDAIRASQESTIAMRVIEGEIETLRALPFTQLAPVEAASLRSNGLDTMSLHKAEGQVRIADVPGTPGLREVTVSIQWTGEKGRFIEKSVSTYIADRGSAL